LRISGLTPTGKRNFSADLSDEPLIEAHSFLMAFFT
jgi:hypothetical protein